MNFLINCFGCLKRVLLCYASQNLCKMFCLHLFFLFIAIHCEILSHRHHDSPELPAQAPGKRLNCGHILKGLPDDDFIPCVTSRDY